MKLLCKPRVQAIELTIFSVQVFTGISCSHVHCGIQPFQGRRFCQKHAHLEHQCAAFLPPLVQGITLESEPRMQRLLKGYFPNGVDKGETIQGHYCDRILPHNTKSIVCNSPLCNHVLRLFQHKGQTEEQLPTDNSDRDKRERIRAWQVVNAQQRVQRKGLLGHFFFVCPCGE